LAHLLVPVPRHKQQAAWAAAVHPRLATKVPECRDHGLYAAKSERDIVTVTGTWGPVWPLRRLSVMAV